MEQLKELNTILGFNLLKHIEVKVIHWNNYLKCIDHKKENTGEDEKTLALRRAHICNSYIYVVESCYFISSYFLVVSVFFGCFFLVGVEMVEVVEMDLRPLSSFGVSLLCGNNVNAASSPELY